jgi:hypothetical protein
MYHFDYIAVIISWHIYWPHLQFISCRSTKKCPKKNWSLDVPWEEAWWVDHLVQGIPQLRKSCNLWVSWWPLLKALPSEDGTVVFGAIHLRHTHGRRCAVACCMSARGAGHQDPSAPTRATESCSSTTSCKEELPGSCLLLEPVVLIKVSPGPSPMFLSLVLVFV